VEAGVGDASIFQFLPPKKRVGVELDAALRGTAPLLPIFSRWMSRAIGGSIIP